MRILLSVATAVSLFAAGPAMAHGSAPYIKWVKVCQVIHHHWHKPVRKCHFERQLVVRNHHHYNVGKVVPHLSPYKKQHKW